MDIRIIKEPISYSIAKEIASEFYKNMVKGVVDLKREIIALGGEWHIDANTKLIDDGSYQENIWGFNFYPESGQIDYVSLINIRPSQNNKAIEIQDERLKSDIEKIIKRLII